MTDGEADDWLCGCCLKPWSTGEEAIACCAEEKAKFREALFAALPSQRRPVYGFMCRTDWEDELGHASDGNRVFPSVEALKRHSPCWEQCGIIEVRVSAETVIEKGEMYGPHDHSPDQNPKGQDT